MTPLQEGDQHEDQPQVCGSGGKSGSKKPQKMVKTKDQTPVHMNTKKALEGMATSVVDVLFEKVECVPGVIDSLVLDFC